MAKKPRQNTGVSAVPPPTASPKAEIQPATAPSLPDEPIARLPAPFPGAHALPASTLWPKGVSANPGGVPRGKRVSTRMAEMMTWTRAELEALKADDSAEVRDHLAARAILRAMKNDDANADMNTLLDRTEGKVAQDFNVRAAPTMTPEQVAEQVRNAGLIPGGPGSDEF